ncbi:MAG: HAMP domain-containing histidine kinase [Candidatus Dormibacteraeota bacterium]|nr:HAMP domain-containing histidine kinase [Candidatus Dormibacteraeota bacterium]
MLHSLRSLRWRLTLAYVVLLAVLLAALGAYSYFSLRSSLIDSRVSSLQSDYDAAHLVITRLAAASGAARGRQLCAAAPSLVARSVATTVVQATGRSVGVVVYDDSLTAVATSPSTANAPQLDPAALHTVASSRARSAPEVIPTASGDQLVVGFPLVLSQRLCGVAQLDAPMAPLDSVLHDDLVRLGVGGAAMLVTALLVGLLLTGRTLRPLRRLTATAHELAAGDLRARSRLVARDDEVGELTQSFDNMADRIEQLFTAQRESEEQTRRFIADASHELRTPLTALNGYIDVLRRGAGRDPGALDSALEAMGSEAERMRHLVLDLLTLARIDAHRGSQPERFDVNDELATILDDGVPGMTAHLERQFAPSPLLVEADRGAVSTIARNLLVNACTYAAGAPQRWSTSVDGRSVRIDVHDDGPGIPAADLPHVFERFYRGEKTRAREEGGSGLGLSIVQGLARAMGGDAAVYSAEGQGTTVSVWIPLAPVTG